MARTYTSPAKLKMLHKVTDPKNKKRIKGKHASWELPVNRVLGGRGILNDDEYKFQIGGHYNG